MTKRDKRMARCGSLPLLSSIETTNNFLLLFCSAIVVQWCTSGSKA